MAASASRHRVASDPIQHRVHTMALWLLETTQAWINQHKIEELHVNIETPVLNVTRKNLGNKCPVCKKPFKSNDRGVTTLMTQVRMLAAYEEILYRLVGVSVFLGEVHNQTAKNVFTGTAKSDKIMMIAHSVWRKRPDVKEREHLADAQAIGTCYPTMVDMSEGDLIARLPTYEDHAIGKGKAWKGKL